MINLPSITTIIGITGSGKSHLAKWIVKDLAVKQKFNNIGLISTTIIEGSNKDDWSCIPSNKKMNFDVASEYITNLIKFHRELEKKNITYHSLVIIDDCMGLIKFNDDRWTVILSTCRHYNISFIIIGQYIKKLPSIVRTQSSYFFFFRMTDILEYKGCYECCFSNMKFNDFKQFITNSLGKFQCIFYNKKDQSLNQNDKILLVQAPSHISPFYINC